MTTRPTTARRQYEGSAYRVTKEHIVKCKHCGHEGDCNGTIDVCANCWEVRKRAEQFLQSPENVAFLKGLLDDAKTPLPKGVRVTRDDLIRSSKHHTLCACGLCVGIASGMHHGDLYVDGVLYKVPIADPNLH